MEVSTLRAPTTNSGIRGSCLYWGKILRPRGELPEVVAEKREC